MWGRTSVFGELHLLITAGEVKRVVESDQQTQAAASSGRLTRLTRWMGGKPQKDGDSSD